MIQNVSPLDIRTSPYIVLGLECKDSNDWCTVHIKWIHQKLKIVSCPNQTTHAHNQVVRTAPTLAFADVVYQQWAPVWTSLDWGAFMSCTLWPNVLQLALVPIISFISLFTSFFHLCIEITNDICRCDPDITCLEDPGKSPSFMLNANCQMPLWTFHSEDWWENILFLQNIRFPYCIFSALYHILE